MKRLIIILATTLITMGTMAQEGFTHSATELAKMMGVGFNLGNTFEAGNNANNFTNKGGLGAETSWQGTATTPEVINYIKSQGFSSIRIPCAWVMGHISDATTYEIDSKWMARVKEVIGYCLDAGLIVVINQHWDGGWLENNINATGTKKETNKVILEAIWRQIATAMAEYDERVIFAGLNEPNADNQTTTNNLKEYEQVFINTVRSTGGNNMLRTLIVQGPTTNIDHTHNYYRTMPTDPAGEGRLMMEIHYYAPWNFWGMEKDESWGNMFYYWGAQNHVSGSKHNPSYDCEEAYMEKELNLMYNDFVKKGIPVVIGEFGANWRNISTLAGEDQDKHNASIKYHYYMLIKLALEKGMVPMVWDTNYAGRPSMTIINRKTLSIYNPYMLDGIHEAMTATGINDITIAPDSPAPSSSCYNLQGQRVTETTKGLIIRNGHKYVNCR